MTEAIAFRYQDRWYCFICGRYVVNAEPITVDEADGHTCNDCGGSVYREPQG